ncbi:hypothetical protein FRB97_006427 [Tulasnella sp. 331]|nr:hypothetical protein FRB97_006427 [Tulasnella sp. 331]
MGLGAFLYRLVRLLYVLLTFPIWCLVVLITHYLPFTFRPAPCRPTWPLVQRVFIPFVGRLVWSITYGVPPKFYEDYIPAQKRRGYIFTHEKALVGKEEWYRGDATDPEGIIVPEPVDVYWVKPDSDVWGVWPSRSVESPEVLLVVSGGGYVEGHPLEGSRCYEITRITGITALATHISRAFPAALQDIITVYHYLMSRGIQRVAIVGLALALLQHLGYLASGSAITPSLIPPIKMVFYSPWVDLTCSFPSFNNNMTYDLLHPTMLCTAAWGYTAAVRKYAARSLEPAIASLKRVADWATPEMFIIWGTAEMLDDEIQSLCENLVKGGFEHKLRQHRWEDEVHIFPILPDILSQNRKEALAEVAEFLLGGDQQSQAIKASIDSR